MSDNLRMLSIVVVFLVAGAVLWVLVSGAGPDDNLSTVVAPPTSLQRGGDSPELEFDSVSRPRGTATTASNVRRDAKVVEEKEGSVESGKVSHNVGPGTLKGTVTVPGGAAVPSDLVITLHFIPDAARFDGSVDTVHGKSPVTSEGTYSFEKLPYGRYTLFGNSAEYTGTSNISITRERPDITRDLELFPAASISGIVTNLSGEPVTDAHVYVAGYLSGGSDLKADLYRSRGSGVGVAEDGSFTIGNLQIRLPALQYRLIASAPGYASKVTDLLPTNATGVSIVLGDGGDVSGIVINRETQAPVADVEVVVGAEYALATKEVSTNEDGEFSLAGLSAGDHSIGIIDDMLVVTSESRTVTVAEGKAIDDVVIEVVTGGTVSGRMYDADTQAGIAGILIYGSPQEIPNAERKEATTDSNGHYQLAGLHSGIYEIEYGEVSGYNSQGRWEDSKNIVTKAGMDIPGIDFALSGGLRISGIVVNEKGQPVNEASVSGYQENSGDQNDYQRTKEDGRFVLSGYKPNTRIRVSANASDLASERIYVDIAEESVTGIRLEMIGDSKISGVIVDKYGNPKGGVGLYVSSADTPYGTQDMAGSDGKFMLGGLMPGTYHLKPYTNNGMSSNDKALETVTVAKGEHKKNIRVVWEMEEGSLKITGRVTDDRGQAVVGASMQTWGFRGGRGNDQVSTDANGNYVFAGLLEGQYQINGTRTGHVHVATQSEAGKSNVDLVMARTGSISGRVVEVGSNAPVSAFSVLVLNPGRPYSSYPGFPIWKTDL